MKVPHVLQSVISKTQYPVNEIRYRADNGELLEVVHTNLASVRKTMTKEVLKDRLTVLSEPFASGVWRYKELVLDLDDKYIVSKPEGNTNLYAVGKGYPNNKGYAHIGVYAGLDQLYLKHEGENPTGSFKDRGMTVGMSRALSLGAKAVACASTGNTSASLASYAAQAGIPCFVFIPEGKISYNKLSQVMAYGATTIQIRDDFDRAMQLVEEISLEMDIYLLNSINPFRIEGQKTIVFELLQQLDWHVPDWIVLPAGNLGNTSALGKGLGELKELGFITKLPRIAAIQAEGANPFYQNYQNGFTSFTPVEAKTIASAIRIGNPVSIIKAQKAIRETNGIVEQVSDHEIMAAKAVIDSAGIGCEPASATTIAGIKKLVQMGKMKADETVVAILTGNLLKDTEVTMQYQNNVNPIFTTDGNTRTVKKIISKRLESMV